METMVSVESNLRGKKRRNSKCRNDIAGVFSPESGQVPLNTERTLFVMNNNGFREYPRQNEHRNTFL